MTRITDKHARQVDRAMTSGTFRFVRGTEPAAPAPAKRLPAHPDYRVLRDDGWWYLVLHPDTGATVLAPESVCLTWGYAPAKE